jgi:hypothetical protein
MDLFTELEFTLLSRRFREFLASPYAVRSFAALTHLPEPPKKEPSKDQLTLF